MLRSKHPILSGLRRTFELLLTSASVLGIACNAYDASRLGSFESPLPASCGDGIVGQGEYCDGAIAEGDPGACPERCPSAGPCHPAALIGDGCQRRCVERTITAPAVADGCCPEGAGAEDDSDCAVCGDGIVSPGERCDPAAKDSCATAATCVSANPCVAVTLQGDPNSCTAHCVRREITTCQSGDECCPIGCDADVDADCSAACGDGRWDVSLGETCDLNSAVKPCPTECDDNDPSTRDVLGGDLENCTAVCEHMPISVRVDGDGVCAPGSTSLDDSDCMPVCGNGIIENGEDCDGDVMCGSSCRTLPPEEMTCRIEFERWTVRSETCEACVCEHCTFQMLDCFVSAFPERNMLCSQVIACARENDCYGQQCLCKDACSAADGPCATVIANATGSSNIQTIRRRTIGEEAFSANSNYASYYALAYDSCVLDKCAAECAPTPQRADASRGAATTVAEPRSARQPRGT